MAALEYWRRGSGGGERPRSGKRRGSGLGQGGGAAGVEKRETEWTLWRTALLYSDW